MATYVFTPQAVAGRARVRFDTASGSTSPATISPLQSPAFTIPGAELVSDPDGNLPPFTSSSATLYQKTLNYSGSTATATATLTGVAAPTGGSGSPGGHAANTSASGAVTVDLSLGAVHVLTLTGNVTSFAFANPGVNGQPVEVHFLQDGTGSRTLSGASSSIKWAANTAPTLTTTANRRDIFRFTQIGGSYYEAGRTLNVP